MGVARVSADRRCLNLPPQHTFGRIRSQMESWGDHTLSDDGGAGFFEARFDRPTQPLAVQATAPQQVLVLVPVLQVR